jgi:hypothetical protein
MPSETHASIDRATDCTLIYIIIYYYTLFMVLGVTAVGTGALKRACRHNPGYQ